MVETREKWDHFLYHLGRSKRAQALLLTFLVGGFIFIYIALKAAHWVDIPIFKWENVAYQMRSGFIKPSEEIKKIVIVDVDDETLWKIHKPWSFPRSIHAEFLKQLAKYNPKLVTFHFMFPGKTEAEEDQALIDAVKASGNVVLASRLTVTGDYLVSEPELESAALASGIISKPREVDNSMRRSYTYFGSGDHPLEVLSSELETLLLNQNMKPEQLKIEPRELGIPLGDGTMAKLPLRQYDSADINYKVNPRCFSHIPYWQIYTGEANADALKDKIVLIGITSRILRDFHGTPLGEMPGVVVNAYNLLMLMTHDFLHRIPEGLQMLLLFVMAAVMSWIGFRYTFFRALGGALCFLLCLLRPAPISFGMTGFGISLVPCWFLSAPF